MKVNALKIFVLGIFSCSAVQWGHYVDCGGNSKESGPGISFRASLRILDCGSTNFAATILFKYKLQGNSEE